jgi:hypothetical protein
MHLGSLHSSNDLLIQLNFLFLAWQRIESQNAVQQIHFLTFSVLKLLCLFTRRYGATEEDLQIKSVLSGEESEE